MSAAEIDVVQTLAIIAVFCVMIYAMWRLESQIRAWARILAEINSTLVGQNDQRIKKLEARLEALEKGAARAGNVAR